MLGVLPVIDGGVGGEGGRGVTQGCVPGAHQGCVPSVYPGELVSELRKWVEFTKVK